MGYFSSMIKSFRDAEAEAVFIGARSRRWGPIGRIARRKLVQLDEAVMLSDLASPPANRLEALRGDRAGQYSIRINDHFRICFRWEDNDAHDVEIVDYH